MELIRLYSDIPEFRQRLHREVIDLSLIHISFLREKKQCWSWWPCVCCAP